MAFPTSAQINGWFENAHNDAVAMGGSVYNMEKYAEQQVVKCVLKWAYANLLDDVTELGYGTRSRINKHVLALYTELDQDQNTEDDYDDYEDNQQDNDDEDENEDQDEDVNQEGEMPISLETLAEQIAELLFKAVVK